MAPNFCKFAAIEEEHFLAGTRVLSALEKLGIFYWKKEFRRDCRKNLQSFVSCVFSNVVARSVIGQGLSFFCHPILVGGDYHALIKLFDMLPDRLLEKGWVRGAETEACKSEHQSFVQELMQLERTSARSRPDVEKILNFCTSQVEFPVRLHLNKV